MPRRAKFFAFEGSDGSGISTQAGLFRDWLLKQGYEAYLTKEPTDGPAGAMLRLALAKRLGARKAGGEFSKVDDHVLALLFAADRMDHLFNDILPKLDSGVMVISDRYYLSSLAYQSVTLDLEWIREINSQCVRPDLTIFFDVPAVICRKRIDRQRWHVELYEEIETLERIRANYLTIIRDLVLTGERIEVVDANQPIQKVHAQVLAAFKKTLSKGTVGGLEQLSLPVTSEKVERTEVP